MFMVKLPTCVSIVAVSVLLSGCASSSLMLSKRNLDVKTQTSASIFLDPVPASQKVVCLQIRNTSDQPEFVVQPQVVAALQQKGYRITDNLNAAHYLLQVNILQVGKSDPSANDLALGGGYGGSVSGVLTGAAVGGLISDTGSGVLAGSLVGGLASMVADSMVKDVSYSVITDVQISERTNARVNERSRSALSQGTSGMTVQSSSTTSHWQRYRTRVVSTAEKVNLNFEQALPKLQTGLACAISGFF